MSRVGGAPDRVRCGRTRPRWGPQRPGRHAVAALRGDDANSTGSPFGSEGSKLEKSTKPRGTCRPSQRKFRDTNKHTAGEGQPIRSRNSEMGTKLFVGGLSWTTDDAGLKGAFERFGEVAEAKVILDRETGRSRGFGFVTFADPSSTPNAIQEMDGATLDGRSIRVNEAQDRPRPARGPGGPPGGPSRGPGGPRPGGGPGGPRGPRDFGGPPPREGGPGRDFGGPPPARGARDDGRRGPGAPPRDRDRGFRERSERDRGFKERGGAKPSRGKRARGEYDDVEDW